MSRVAHFHRAEFHLVGFTAVSAGLGRVAKYMEKKLNREMLERPNICYIFEKLRVQLCQIWAIISSVMDTFLTVFVLQSKN